ncbi:Anaphase-promoting complex subunit 11 [Nosema bombycis CQ1]|jgi:anaphase-promoting complex subunit 11|uniref:Anaphase-promoting complex subunit 11 n=1 Tax=Nosema bombycis (strain CQ1 / CVCC 102059) TaxID=578461 RepID=R0M5F4_NOSB1|nr:Anaphase-promoting complex subunit 11 [Nosema bombycis CQ1]|eukprot:EOB13234.1 Anaphase-promoting complex subunit 11 [Nosema bombycis CQ1]
MVEFKIKNVYLTYNWKWNVDEEICGICQQGFDQMCPKCVHPIECKPCVGECKHTFHVHCLDQWLLKRNICPMCRVNWVIFRKFE